MIFPGVRVTIKTARRWIRDAMQQVIFLKEGGDVVLSGELAEASEEQKAK
jgi:hypothetical protein